MNHHLLGDMSSIIWFCLLAGQDRENGVTVEHEGKKVLVNSAQYGYDNAINHITSALKQLNLQPIDFTMVIEGKDSKMLREGICADYKAHRGDRPEGAYEEFSKCKDMLVETFLGLGSRTVTQDKVEADDVIAYLALNLKEQVTILSTDGDMLALVNDRVHLLYKHDLDENRYGPWPHKYTTLYKALVGDTSDNIKGAHGFGKAAFLDLYCIFGDEGLDAMIELIESRNLDRLLEDVGDFKKLQKIIDDKQGVYVSWDLARMYPERVNTMRRPLRIKQGVVKPLREPDERLARYAGVVKLASAVNVKKAFEWFENRLGKSPFVAFDIETSTPEESDEWLLAKSKKADEDDLGVDVFGSTLTGGSLTFGENLQYTIYIPVDHNAADDNNNCTKDEFKTFLKEVQAANKTIQCHNSGFELSVCARELDLGDNGFHGFLPNVEDTLIQASYVDENEPAGLKKQSLLRMGYQQVSYDEVTTIDGERYKMNELSASHVLAYGADDTICTAALHLYNRFVMSLEGTYPVYQEVEVEPAYLLAKAFNDGTRLSLQRMFELEREDELKYAESEKVLMAYLISKGWEGTVLPVYGPEPLTAAQIKEAHEIVEGEEFKTQVRTPTKLVPLLEEAGRHLLAAAVEASFIGNFNYINDLVKTHFNGSPVFDLGSAKQLGKLMYEVMGLPVRIRNKPTDIMREKGIYQGSPQTNEMAIEHALHYDKDIAPIEVLKAIQAMKTVQTRRNLYYTPYRFVQHWSDQLVHANQKQCATVTRRGACSGPNLGQLPKRGEGVKFREVFVPRNPDEVVVSFDFEGQELGLGAHLSQDANMLSCFVGDNKRDIHSLTGVSILKKKYGVSMDYDTFRAVVKDDTHEYHKRAVDIRKKEAKTVNFADQYDAQAASISRRLLCSEEDAQQFLDAKAEMFPGMPAWKEKVREKVAKLGYSSSMLGARRHLARAMMFGDRWDEMRAERQGPNYEIQGSGAEMAKKAMGRFWSSGIQYSLRCTFIMWVHDELVFSVHKNDLIDFIVEGHKIMTEPYADLCFPVTSSISFGPNFGQQEEIGNQADPEVISNAYKKVYGEELIYFPKPTRDWGKVIGFVKPGSSIHMNLETGEYSAEIIPLRTETAA